MYQRTAGIGGGHSDRLSGQMLSIHLKWHMRALLVTTLALASFSAFAEGRCPPGQYPIGDQNVGGCAPIPGAAQSSPRSPSGTWETRWGAVAEDTAPVAAGGTLATGVSVSQNSKRAANALAISRCEGMGGQKCKIRLTYHNQCVAMADPVGVRVPGAISTANTGMTLELARSSALDRCQSVGGQRCEVFYSACSSSEFREY